MGEVRRLSERYREIKKVLWLVLGLNLLVSLAKLVVGRLANSAAIVADGFHSLSDGTSNIVGLIGISAAARPVDEDHPYGHGKFETLASLGIGLLLWLVAGSVFRGVWNRWRNPLPPTVESLQFLVMLGTMLVNWLVTRYERRQGERLNSELLKADAAHTRTDLYVSATVVASLVAVRLGYLVMDLVASLIIGVLIIKVGWEIIAGGFRVLTDSAILDPAEVTEAILEVPGVASCHQIRSRGRTDQVYLDVHVQVMQPLSLEEGHALAHAVEDHLLHRFPMLVEAAVHVEPTAAELGDSPE